MIKTRHPLNKLAYLLVLGGFMSSLQAQEMDPAGFVNKYNPEFKGIGPEVYVLPSPRSKEDLLMDSYKAKASFADTIDQALGFQQLLNDFKFTSSEGYIQRFYNPLPDTGEKLNHLINNIKAQGNLVLASGLMNQYAWQYLKENNVNQAIGILIGALDNIRKTDHVSDQKSIQSNLTNLYIFNQNYSEAAKLQEQFLSHAMSRKLGPDQADAWVKIAIVQAYKKDFKLAENSIIRKAIPLYNRAKNYNAKILAWQHLAKIYQMHDKHTEAQWFLIQARDLAKARRFMDELAEIEFMLASSKLAQKNYKVAQKEFENARELAKKEKNELLALAIHDKLGEVLLALEKYEDAEKELEQYWELRNKIFQS